jgi:hypothetical protein
MRVMLGELEAQAERAREHERRMVAGIRESESWSEPEDRGWILRAAAEAMVAREDAEARVVEGRALLARVQSALDLDVERCAIARCVCGASWLVGARGVRGVMPGVVAHKPGALICADCGAMARLDLTPAPAGLDGEG